jgi:Protein of unknown function (DUF2442)
MSPKVTKVEPLENFTLRLFFSNGEVKRFDVTPYLEQGIFVELKDIHYFNRVKPFFGGVQWLHEQDFSADTLYLKSQTEIGWQATQQVG